MDLGRPGGLMDANDALSAVTRLVDMGIEPYLVAAALKATMAQRLVRRLCPDCAQPAQDTSMLDARWDGTKRECIQSTFIP